MKNILFLLYLFFLSMLFISIEYRLALPYAYYLLSFVIAILSTVMIYRSDNSKQWVVLPIAALCVFLRSIFLIASGFSLIPLSDGYTDYMVSNIFLENGRSFLVTSGTGQISAAYASGWPLVHILAVSLSTTMNMDLLHVVLVLPLIFGVVILAFIYLFTREIVQKLGLNPRIVSLAVFFYAISSDDLYTSMQFTRQTFAVLFVIIILYLLYKLATSTYGAKLGRIKLLFLVFSFSLVLSHCFSAFTMFLFFFFFLILVKIGNRIQDRVKLKISYIPLHSISFYIPALFSAAMFTWWIFHSPMVLTTYIPFLNFHLSLYTDQLDLASIRWDFYGVLRPQPYVNLLTLSYLILYVSLVIGFLIFVRRILSKKKINVTEQFLVYSSMIFFTIFSIFEFIVSQQPMRVLWFAAPFIALFTALLYDRLFSAKKALWRVLAATLLITVAFSIFLAPWSRGYMPLYVYEPSVKFEDVGSHNPFYINVVHFVREHVLIEQFQGILSDDDELLYVILPTESYQSIRNLHSNPEMINDTNVIMFEFLHLNPSFENVPYIAIGHAEVIQNIEYFKHQITYKFNIVYDDGSSKIRISQNQSQT